MATSQTSGTGFAVRTCPGVSQLPVQGHCSSTPALEYGVTRPNDLPARCAASRSRFRRSLSSGDRRLPRSRDGPDRHAHRGAAATDRDCCGSGRTRLSTQRYRRPERLTAKAEALCQSKSAQGRMPTCGALSADGSDMGELKRGRLRTPETFQASANKELPDLRSPRDVVRFGQLVVSRREYP